MITAEMEASGLFRGRRFMLVLRRRLLLGTGRRVPLLVLRPQRRLLEPSLGARSCHQFSRLLSLVAVAARL
jgi:hypothetical protein